MIENTNQNLNQENERNQSGNNENRTENRTEERTEGTEQRTGAGFQQQEREEGNMGRGESSRTTGLGEESEQSSETENKGSERDQDV